MALGCGLFGGDALRSGKMTRPIVMRWLKLHVTHKRHLVPHPSFRIPLLRLGKSVFN